MTPSDRTVTHRGDFGRTAAGTSRDGGEVPVRRMGPGGTRGVRPRHLGIPDAALVAGLAVVAALLRAGPLDPSTLWFNDAWAALVARADTVGEVLLPALTAPGWTLGLWAWLGAAGFSNLAAQLPAFALGVAGPPALYLLARRMGISRAGAGLGAAVLLTAPAHVTYSSRVKPYALDALLVVVLLGAAWAVLAGGGGWRRWAGYGGLAALATALSGAVAPVAAGAGGAVLVALWRWRARESELAVASAGGRARRPRHDAPAVTSASRAGGRPSPPSGSPPAGPAPRMGGLPLVGVAALAVYALFGLAWWWLVVDPRVSTSVHQYWTFAYLPLTDPGAALAATGRGVTVLLDALAPLPWPVTAAALALAAAGCLWPGDGAARGAGQAGSRRDGGTVSQEVSGRGPQPGGPVPADGGWAGTGGRTEPPDVSQRAEDPGSAPPTGPVVAGMALGPVLVAMGLAALELAPFGGFRTETVLLPGLALLVAGGADRFLRAAAPPGPRPGRWSPGRLAGAAGGSVTGKAAEGSHREASGRLPAGRGRVWAGNIPGWLVTGVPVASVAAVLVALAVADPPGYPVEDLRPLLRHVEDHRRPGDRVVAYPPTRFVLALYTTAPVDLVPAPGSVFGWEARVRADHIRLLVPAPGDLPAYRAQVAAAAGRAPRVWFLASHLKNDLPAHHRMLEALGYRLTDRLTRPGAELTVWQLSVTGRRAAGTGPAGAAGGQPGGPAGRPGPGPGGPAG